MSYLKRTFAYSMLAAATYAASSAYAANDESIDHGWFWYEVKPEVVEPKPEPKKPKPVVQAPKPKEPKRFEPEKPKAPPVFSVAWFNANLDKYLNAAIDNPTPENIKAYLTLQAVSLDKAKRFQQEATMVSSGDPYLDGNTKRSFANSMGYSIDYQADKKSQQLAKDISSKAGVFFFFSSDCYTCELAGQGLETFTNRFGTDVLPISMDGKDLPNVKFENPIRTNEGQAQMLGVTTLPAYFLVDPAIVEKDGLMAGVEPIAQGAVSDTDLRERILIAATRKGWISQDEYDLTKPARMDLNVTRILDQQTGGNSSSALQNFTSTYGDETGFVPPEILTDMINQTISSKVIDKEIPKAGSR